MLVRPASILCGLVLPSAVLALLSLSCANRPPSGGPGTYRGVLDANRVVEFMLLDRLFPRSIMYSLKLAEHSLDELMHRQHNRIGATAEAQRLLGRARSELEFIRPGVLLESLEQRLAALQATCRDVGEAVTLQYFYSAPWVAWSDAGHNGALVVEEGEI